MDVLRNFRNTVATKFAEWTDATVPTQEEADQCAALRTELMTAQSALSRAREARNRAQTDFSTEYSVRRTSLEDAAAPKLDALDIMDTAKLVYDQISSHVNEAAFKVRTLQQAELQGYGYQSKMISSLSISLDSLRQRMAHGLPFRRELTALTQEMIDAKEINHVAVSVSEFADEGIAARDALLAQARIALASFDQSALDRSSARGLEQREEQQTTALGHFASWVASLKVSVPDGGAAQQDPFSSRAAAGAKRKILTDTIEDLTHNRLDKALAALKHETDGDSTDDGDEQIRKLRRMIEGRLLGDTALRFADSMVALHRFRCVEPVLTASMQREL